MSGTEGQRNLELRYDFLEVDTKLRRQILDSLKEQKIKHTFAGGILTVGRQDEVHVDEIIATWEKWGDQQESTNDQSTPLSSPTLPPNGSKCERCGKSPAAQIVLRRTVGLVIVASTAQAQLILCEPCASSATKEFQKQTALKGWTSMYSAAINPFILGSNAKNRRKHRREIQRKS